jgi:hypothetical protein
MTNEEQVRAHRFFSVGCFNQIWAILDKKDRDPGDIEAMIHLAHSSFWHWSKSPEQNSMNLSVGYWMLSRVYATAMDDYNALIYARKCLDISIDDKLEPFYVAYAYEAMARACSISGEIEMMDGYLQKGLNAAELVMDIESQSLVKADLDNIIAEDDDSTEDQ